jgi:hypothetical protein
VAGIVVVTKLELSARVSTGELIALLPGML